MNSPTIVIILLVIISILSSLSSKSSFIDAQQTVVDAVCTGNEYEASGPGFENSIIRFSARELDFCNVYIHDTTVARIEFSRASRSNITIKNVTCTPQRQLICVYFDRPLTEVSSLIIDNVTLANIDLNSTNLQNFIEFPTSDPDLEIAVVYFRRNLVNVSQISISNIFLRDISCTLLLDMHLQVRAVTFSNSLQGALVLFDEFLTGEQNDEKRTSSSFSTFSVSNVVLQNINLVAFDDRQITLQALYSRSISQFGSVTIKGLAVTDCTLNGSDKIRMNGFASESLLSAPSPAIATIKVHAQHHHHHHLLSVTEVSVMNNSFIKSYDVEIISTMINGECENFAVILLSSMRFNDNTISSSSSSTPSSSKAQIYLGAVGMHGDPNVAVRGAGDYHPSMFSQLLLFNIEFARNEIKVDDNEDENIGVVVNVVSIGRKVRGFHLVEMHSIIMSDILVVNVLVDESFSTLKFRRGMFRQLLLGGDFDSALPDDSNNNSSSSFPMVETQHTTGAATTSFLIYNLTVVNFNATISSSISLTTVLSSNGIRNFSTVVMKDIINANISLHSDNQIRDVISRILVDVKFLVISFLSSSGIYFGILGSRSLTASVPSSLLPAMNYQSSGSLLLFENISADIVDAVQIKKGSTISGIALAAISNYRNVILQRISLSKCSAQIIIQDPIEEAFSSSSSSSIVGISATVITNIIESFVVTDIVLNEVSAVSAGAASAVGFLLSQGDVGIRNVRNVTVSNFVITGATTQGLYKGGSEISAVKLETNLSASSLSSSSSLTFENISLTRISVRTPLDLSEIVLVFAKGFFGFSRVRIHQLRISNADIKIGAASPPSSVNEPGRFQLFRVETSIDALKTIAGDNILVDRIDSSSSSLTLMTSSFSMNDLALVDSNYHSQTETGSRVGVVELGLLSSSAILTGYEQVSFMNFHFQNCDIFSKQGDSMFTALLSHSAMVGVVSSSSSSSASLSSLLIRNFLVSSISVTVNSSSSSLHLSAVDHLPRARTDTISNFTDSILITNITVQHLSVTSAVATESSSTFEIRAISLSNVETSSRYEARNILLWNCTSSSVTSGATFRFAGHNFYGITRSISMIVLRDVRVASISALLRGSMEVLAVSMPGVVGRGSDSSSSSSTAINKTTSILISDAVVENIHIASAARIRSIIAIIIGRASFLSQVNLSNSIIRNVVREVENNDDSGEELTGSWDVTVRCLAFNALEGAIPSSSPSSSLAENNQELRAVQLVVRNITIDNVNLTSMDDGITFLTAISTQSIKNFGSVTLNKVTVKDCTLNSTDINRIYGFVSGTVLSAPPPLLQYDTGYFHHHHPHHHVVSVTEVAIINNTLLNTYDVELINIIINGDVKNFSTIQLAGSRCVDNIVLVSSSSKPSLGNSPNLAIIGMYGDPLSTLVRGAGDQYPEIFSQLLVYDIEFARNEIQVDDKEDKDINVIMTAITFSRKIRGFHLVELHSIVMSDISVVNTFKSGSKLRRGFFRLVVLGQDLISAFPHQHNNNSSSSSPPIMNTHHTTDSTSFLVHNFSAIDFTVAVSSSIVVTPVLSIRKILNFSTVVMKDIINTNIFLRSDNAASTQVISVNFIVISLASSGIYFGILDDDDEGGGAGSPSASASVPSSLLPAMNNQSSGSLLLFENISAHNVDALQVINGASVLGVEFGSISNYRNVLFRGISLSRCGARLETVRILTTSSVVGISIIFVSNVAEFVATDIRLDDVVAISVSTASVVGFHLRSGANAAGVGIRNVRNVTVSNVVVSGATARGLYGGGGSQISAVRFSTILSPTDSATTSTSASSSLTVKDILINNSATLSVRNLVQSGSMLTSIVRAVEMGGLTPIESSSSSSTTSFHHQFFGFDFVTISDLQINTLEMNSLTIDALSSTHSTGNTVAGLFFVRLPTAAHSVVSISNIALRNVEVRATAINEVSGVQSFDSTAMPQSKSVHINNVSIEQISSDVYLLSFSSISAVNLELLENVAEFFIIENIHLRGQIVLVSPEALSVDDPAFADAVSYVRFESVKNLPSSSSVVIRNIKHDFSSSPTSPQQEPLLLLFNSSIQPNISIVTIGSFDVSSALGSFRIEDCNVKIDSARTWVAWFVDSRRQNSLLFSLLHLRSIAASTSSSSSKNNYQRTSTSLEMNSNTISIRGESPLSASNLSMLFLDPSSMLAEFNRSSSSFANHQQQPLNIRLFNNQIIQEASSSLPSRALSSLIATSANSAPLRTPVDWTPPPLTYSITLQDNFIPYGKSLLFSTPTSDTKTEHLENLMLTLYFECNRWLRLVEEQLRGTMMGDPANADRIIRLCTSPTRTFTFTNESTKTPSHEESLTFTKEGTSTLSSPPSPSQSVSLSNELTLTENISSSPSIQETPTETIIVPPPPYISALRPIYDAMSDASTFSQALTLSSAAAFSAIQTRSTLTAVNRILENDCGLDESVLDREPGLPSSPLKFYLPSGGYISGTVLGNVVLIFALSTLWYALFWMKNNLSSSNDDGGEDKDKKSHHQRRKDEDKKNENVKKSKTKHGDSFAKDSFVGSIVKTKTTNRIFITMDLFLEPTLTAAVQLLLFSTDAVSILTKLISSVVVFVFYIIIGYGAFINFYFFSREERHEIFVVPSDDERNREFEFLDLDGFRRFVILYLTPSGEWQWPVFDRESKQQDNNNSGDNGNNQNNNENKKKPSSTKEEFDEEKAAMKFIHKTNEPIRRPLPSSEKGHHQSPSLYKDIRSLQLLLDSKSAAKDVNNGVHCLKGVELYSKKLMTPGDKKKMKQNDNNNSNSSSNTSLIKNSFLTSSQFLFLSCVRLLEPFNDRFSRFIIVEVVTTILTSLSFIIGAITNSCSNMTISLIVVMILHLLISGYFRPYNRRFFNIFVPLLDLASAALLTLTLIVFNDTNNSKNSTEDDVPPPTLAELKNRIDLISAVALSLAVAQAIFSVLTLFGIGVVKLNGFLRTRKLRKMVEDLIRNRNENEEELLLMDNNRETEDWSPRARSSDETTVELHQQRRAKRKRRKPKHDHHQPQEADENDEENQALLMNYSQSNHSNSPRRENQEEEYKGSNNVADQSTPDKKKKLIVTKKKKRNIIVANETGHTKNIRAAESAAASPTSATTSSAPLTSANLQQFLAMNERMEKPKIDTSWI